MKELLTINKPLVSVVLPTYNRVKYLQLAIESVLSQSMTDFELIIINDGSTDLTEKLVNKYKDKRIIYVRQSNKGEYPATNLGLRTSEGKFVTWIHSDDLWPKNTLEIRTKELQRSPRIDFVHGDIENIDENGKNLGKVKAIDFSAKQAFKEYLKSESERKQKYLVHHTTIMFRKEFIFKAGYWDESLPYAGDTDWMLRALKFGKMKKVSGVLYYYRNHPNARRITDREKGVDTKSVVDLILDRYRDK
ncbi:glycosyltransferase [Patescibacteria group bacterium]